MPFGQVVCVLTPSQRRRHISGALLGPRPAFGHAPLDLDRQMPVHLSSRLTLYIDALLSHPTLHLDACPLQLSTQRLKGENTLLVHQLSRPSGRDRYRPSRQVVNQGHRRATVRSAEPSRMKDHPLLVD